MSIFDNFRARRRERVIKEYLAQNQQTPSAGQLLRQRLAGWTRTDYTLHNSEILFSAISRMANAISVMPWQLYRKSKPVYNELNDLITARPNPNMTSHQFFKAMEVCRCATGNAYAMKVYDAQGVLSRLDVLDPTKVTPVMDEDSRELWYRITLDSGKQAYFHNFYIIHVPFLTTNGYTGINPVCVLFDTLRYAEDIQKFNRDQLDDGVNTSIVLEAPANLSNEQRMQVVKDFMETYRETSGAVLLLESGVTAKSLNLSPIDAKLFEVEKITRSKVAMVYNIPPHLLGDYSATSYASQEQQMLEFMQLTLLSPVTAYEQEFNRKLIPAEARKAGFSFAMNMEAILRADATTQANVDQIAIRNGWTTVDEVRSRRNLPPYAGGIGKIPVVSQDLAPLEYTVKEKPGVLREGGTNE